MGSSSGDSSDEDVHMTSDKDGSDREEEEGQSESRNIDIQSPDPESDGVEKSSPVATTRRRHSSSSASGDEERQPPAQKATTSSPQHASGSDDERSNRGSDSDGERGTQAARDNATAKDMFGSDSDEDEDVHKKSSAQQSRQGSESPSGDRLRGGGDNEDDEDRNDESRVRQNESQQDEERSGDEDEDRQPVEKPVVRIDADIPRMVANLGSELYFVKFPNFLSVDTHPYDASWYEDEIDDEEALDEEGKHRMKLKVENTIRWKTLPDPEGTVHRESNARIVKWSDDSYSLHLGSEIFDIHKNQLLQGENSHLFVRQGLGLQGQAVFNTKLTFRPHSTDSFTHRKMTLSLAEKSNKTHKVMMMPTVGLDPEAHRSEMIKKEEDRLKASIRRENKVRRVRERSMNRGPTASYLEPDDEEDEDGAISLSAIKNKFKQNRGAAYADTYTDDSDDDASDLDIGKRSADSKKKKAKIEESDDDDD